MGGTIGVQSRLGDGSTFFADLTFPLAPDVDAGGTGATPAGEPGCQGRVLVVHGDAAVRRVVSCQLETLGFAVDAAASGRAALDAAAAGRYTAVLMNASLPDFDGLAVIAEIRRREAGSGRRLLVVGLMGCGSDSQRDRCLAAGMDGVLTKPVKRAALADLLVRGASRDAHDAARLTAAAGA